MVVHFVSCLRLWLGCSAESNTVQVAQLLPPSVFGEEAILDPLIGRLQVTAVAETFTECLVISATQLERYRTNPAFMQVRGSPRVHPTLHLPTNLPPWMVPGN